MPKYQKNQEAISRLSPEQYEVTQRNGTERPFKNAYWENKEPGLYVDVVSGEPLFTSMDKFDSDCGWPSFTKPVERENVLENRDTSHGMIRTEVCFAGCRQLFGPRIPGLTSGCGRFALLYQFRRSTIHSRQSTRNRRIRRLPPTVPSIARRSDEVRCPLKWRLLMAVAFGDARSAMSPPQA